MLRTCSSCNLHLAVRHLIFYKSDVGFGLRLQMLRRLLIGEVFSFFRPLLTYTSPGSFPPGSFSFVSVTNITKSERLRRAASRAISGCFLSSPIPLLFSKVSLSLLRVTLSYVTYERALRLPNSFLISGLARLGAKPRLCRSSWRAFAYTHPLLLLSSSPRKALLACSPLLGACFPSLWSPFFLPHAPALTPSIPSRYQSRPP